MNLRQLPLDDVQKAYDVADYLLRLPVRLNPELVTKLDTFRADVGVELEDRKRADLGARRRAAAATG